MQVPDIHQWLLRVDSGYRQLQNVEYRFSPESGYTKGVNFNAAYSSNRPKVDVQIISSDRSDQDQKQEKRLFNKVDFWKKL
jgi:hypothetical protein